MLKFTDRTTTPPGGAYPYVRSESGMRFRQIAFTDLLKEVKDHCAANGYPIGINFEAEVEDASCRELLRLYPNFEGCRQEDGSRPFTPGRKWHLADVRSFLNTMGRLVNSEEKFVSQEEAERRANICIRCPKNQDMAECWGCSGIAGMIRSVKGSRSTSIDNNLKICDCCGCDLKTKIWIRKDILFRDDVDWPSFCWNRKDEGKTTSS